MLKHASFWIPQTYAVLYLGSIEAKTHWIPLFLGGFATMLPFFVTRFSYFICQWISQSISFFFTGFHKQIFNCFKMYPRRPISKRDTHKLLNFSLSPLFHFNFLFFSIPKRLKTHLSYILTHFWMHLVIYTLYKINERSDRLLYRSCWFFSKSKEKSRGKTSMNIGINALFEFNWN